jgi:hypothetical protein
MKTTMARDETLFDSVVGPSSHFKCSVHSSTVTLNTEKLCGVVVSFLGPLRSHSGTCGVRVVTKKHLRLSPTDNDGPIPEHYYFLTTTIK